MTAMRGSGSQRAQSSDAETAGGSSLDLAECSQKETEAAKWLDADEGGEGVGGSVGEKPEGRVLEMARAMVGLWVLGVNWEVVRWYVSRLGDGGDEPWGLVALAAALVLTPQAVWRARMSNTALAASAGLAVAAVVMAGILPVLVRGGLVAGALGAVIGRAAVARRGSGAAVVGGAAGRLGLLLLSLPVVATAQFYAGYPLRVITAELGRPLLWLAGVATERSGVVLSWAGGEVVVDAPCSGVRMLWAGLALACGLAAWRRVRRGQAATLAVLAVAGVVVANAVRAAVLFLTESGVWPNAGWLHETVGAAVFGGVAVGLWELARRWGVQRGVATEEANTEVAKIAEGGARAGFRVWGWIGVGVGVGVAGWSLVRADGVDARNLRGGGAMEETGVRVVWPEVFEGRPLMPVAAGDGRAGFVSGFSGETRVFEQPGRVVIVRWLKAASRGVHPAADCFRARGYGVGAGGLVRDDAGGRWSEFVAERGEERWKVRERWRDGFGNVWTDVSAWWWAAQGAGARGPWWAETVAVRE
jgi:exosortase/archaeosortase family protein